MMWWRELASFWICCSPRACRQPIGNREHGALVDVPVKMDAAGGNDYSAALRLDPTIQALGVAADLVHGDAGREFPGAIMEFAAIGEDLAHHRVDVALADGMRSVW